MNASLDLLAPDLERRFGGLRRLYGEAGYQAVRAARIGVVGLGGVGSWAVEALARSGVAELTLFDMDHVAESNINRQVQAMGATIGQAKGVALRERIADIHPGCDVQLVDDFVSPDNWPALLTREVDVIIDACDQVHAKTAMAHWALQAKLPFVSVGAAGGKQRAQAIEVDDLALVTHDPLLASLRQRLRKQHGAARAGAIGVRCVFSRERVLPPAGACESDGSLNCHGYGSSVVVTASFGFVAAGEALQSLLRRFV
ncbi:MAG TPA: tRNA threonylcarbamoyladenosine dehydratase [Rhizobacter sp.]|nr:tRNA threonylcarbamoyladenosine dehydratase [Rhizobacter sp.]